MKMNSPRRIRNNRAKWLLGFFLTVMVILIGRLAYVQIFEKMKSCILPAVRFMTVTAISWQFL